MTTPRLYDYWRSSASYRVRIALNLCGIEFDAVSVDLLKGEHGSPEHLARNPQGFVPVLEIDGLHLTQSLAIIEYLDETRGAGFLPKDARWPRKGARACPCHRHGNPSGLQSFRGGAIQWAGASGEEADAMRTDWMKHFIRKGPRRIRDTAGSPGNRRFLPRGNARPCRFLSRTAGLQCRSLGSGYFGHAASWRHLDALRGTAGLCRGSSGQLQSGCMGLTARCRVAYDVAASLPPSTISPNLSKNCPASFFDVESISREPSWAILPPTSALAV